MRPAQQGLQADEATVCRSHDRLVLQVQVLHSQAEAKVRIEACSVGASTPLRVRDEPWSGRPVTLLWLKRLWRCTEPACSVRTWSETTEHVWGRASLTERARQEACRLVGEDGLDVAAVATTLGVGWHTVMRAVRDYGRPLVDDPARTDGVVAVGVDETAFLAASAGSHTRSSPAS